MTENNLVSDAQRSKGLFGFGTKTINENFQRSEKYESLSITLNM